MADITAAPDYLVQLLRNAKDHRGAEVGEEPKTVLEIASERVIKARLDARERILKNGESKVTIKHTITIVDTITSGPNGAVRVESPAISITVTASKPPEYDGKGGWIDEEGNQIGEVERQTTIAAVAAIDKSGAKPQKTKAS